MEDQFTYNCSKKITDETNQRRTNDANSTERKASLTQLPNRTGANETKTRKSSGKISEDRQRDGGDYRKETQRPNNRTSQETVERRLPS